MSMNHQRQVRISKFLSRHLRHDPAGLGLELAPGGWVAVADLLTRCQQHGLPLTLDELKVVVAESDKQRFAFDATGLQIRANQGHSVAIDLQLTEARPPALLYHGTGAGSVASICATGLLKRNRHHVHLSADQQTARLVGQRHGPPVIFEVASGSMHADGIPFFCSANGVWLVDFVAPHYLRILD